MATRSRPEELVRSALEDDLVPLGRYKARVDDDGFVTTYPEIAVDANDVDRDTRFKVFLDQETGATVTIPVEALGDEREQREAEA